MYKKVESRPSKDHQCQYWLSCAVKVLIKNEKSAFFNSQRKKANLEPVSRWSCLTNSSPRTSLLFVKEWRRPGDKVTNLSGFSTPFLLRWLCVSIFWICWSNEALKTKLSTIITHHVKKSCKFKWLMTS